MAADLELFATRDVIRSESPLAKGLVGLWVPTPSLAGGTYLYDLTGLSPLTMAGFGAGYGWCGSPDGRELPALRYDGTNSRATSNSAKLALSLDLSFHIRFLRTRNSAYETLVAKGLANNVNRQYLFALSSTADANIYGVVGGELSTPTQESTLSGSMSVGTWVDLTCTWDQATLRYFLNGFPAGTRAVTPTGTVAGGFSLGMESTDGTIPLVPTPFQGVIAWAGLWDRRLTTGESVLCREESLGGHRSLVRRARRSPSFFLMPVSNFVTVDAANTVTFSPSASGPKLRPASASSDLTFTLEARSNPFVPVLAANTITLTVAASQVRKISVGASGQVTFSPVALGKGNFIRVVAETTMAFGVADDTPRHAPRIAGSAMVFVAAASAKTDKVPVTAISHIQFTDVGAGGKHYSVFGNDTFVLSSGQSNAGKGRRATAETIITFHSATVPRGIGVSGMVFTAEARASLPPIGQSTVRFSARAEATTLLPPPSSGLRRSLYSGCSQLYPNSYAQTSEGLLMIANGVDPVLKWDGASSQAVRAGLLAPTQAPTLDGEAVTVGGYTAYLRFVDDAENLSNLSPISNMIRAGKFGLIEDIVYDTIPTGLVVGQVVGYRGIRIKNTGHGLATGDQITIQDVPVPREVNAKWTVQKIDDNNFSLGLAATPIIPATGPSNYVPGSGGTWVQEVQVHYSGVQVPAEPRVKRRQLFRNTSQQTDVYYLDIDTADLVSTSFSSTKDDNDLIASDPLAILDTDGRDIANVHGLPPNHKCIILSQLGRMFLAVDRVVSEGTVAVTAGSATVVGVGTRWAETFAGRNLHVVGARKPYFIQSVDAVAQTLVLSEPWGSSNGDGSNPYADYAIRPQPTERRKLYYSEALSPESWSPFNAVTLDEDNDEITGLMSFGSFLYILEEHHIYRYTYQGDPAQQQGKFLAANRGCVNDRCCAIADGVCYMLDEIGVHQFSGDESISAVSSPIQDLFQGTSDGDRVNYDADRTLWHAAVDPVRETIRWFVSFNGDREPRHALCYQYHQGQWWLERYPIPMTASCVATLGNRYIRGSRKSLAGTVNRRVVALAEGNLDGPTRDDGPTLRGTATDSGPAILVDAAASFDPADLADAPVAIVTGPGAGQERRIVSATATSLSVDRPWAIAPRAGDTYQVGGVSFEWRGGWYRFAPSDDSTDRTLEVVFEPQRRPAALDLRIYHDHARGAASWDRTSVSDGIAVIRGEASIRIDLTVPDGFAQVRGEGHREVRARGVRYVQYGLSGVGNAVPLRLYHLRANALAPTEAR